MKYARNAAVVLAVAMGTASLSYGAAMFGGGGSMGDAVPSGFSAYVDPSTGLLQSDLVMVEQVGTDGSTTLGVANHKGQVLDQRVVGQTEALTTTPGAREGGDPDANTAGVGADAADGIAGVH